MTETVDGETFKQWVERDAKYITLWIRTKAGTHFRRSVLLDSGEGDVLVELEAALTRPAPSSPAVDPVTVEACAKVCDGVEKSAKLRADNLPSQSESQNAYYEKASAANVCARSIRALIGQPAPSSTVGERHRVVANADCLDCQCDNNNLCKGTEPRKAALSPRSVEAPVAWQKRPKFGGLRIWTECEPDDQEFWEGEDYEVRPLYACGRCRLRLRH